MVEVVVVVVVLGDEVELEHELATTNASSANVRRTATGRVIGADT